MLNPLLLESINGTLAVSSLILLFVFGRYYLLPEATDRGKQVVRALAVFFFGECMVRGWIWLWRHQLNDGVDVAWMNSYPMPIIGGSIALFGVVCLIRVFSSALWPMWVWATAVFSTVVVIVLMAVM